MLQSLLFSCMDKADAKISFSMKRSELFFSALQVPIDFAMIVLAALTAFAVRDIPQILALKPKLYAFSFDAYMQIILIVAPLFLLIYALEGLYAIRATRRIHKEAWTVFKSTSIILVIIIVSIFLKREWFSSRFIILAGWGFVVVYVVFARTLLRSLQKWLLVKRGIGRHRVLLIGTNGKIKNLQRMLQRNPYLGYHVIGQVDNVALRQIKEIRTQCGIDEIILCEPSVPDDEIAKLVDFCEINNITYKFIPTSLQTTRFSISIFNGEPLIELQSTPLEGWGKILKRTFDLVGAAALIILFAPLMLIVALLIKVTDPAGPIIYKNERIGSDGKKFYAYKFRYMKWRYSISRDNPHFKEALAYEKQLITERSVRHGPLYKIKNDPRKTVIGRFIERYSIDELPQFFNVLNGEMSLVGPRPHQEREVEKYKEYHRRLLTINPGVTGMAQISGRSDLDFEDEYRLDVYYIENWSLWLDILIMLKTLGVIFSRRKNVS